MKIEIEIQELNINQNDIFDLTKYPKWGFYKVNDQLLFVSTYISNFGYFNHIIDKIKVSNEKSVISEEFVLKLLAAATGKEPLKDIINCK